MSVVELLTVEDCFEIGDLGVVLCPDLSVPNGRWKARTDKVTVVRPDGQQFETTAEFNLSHLNISDPSVSIDRRWRVILSLPGRTKGELPVGTKVLVSQEMRDALFPKNTG
jgi:hypothetical protein